MELSLGKDVCLRHAVKSKKRQTPILANSLITVHSEKDTLVKLPNGDEFYSVTVSYVATEFEGQPGIDGVESTAVGFLGIQKFVVFRSS